MKSGCLGVIVMAFFFWAAPSLAEVPDDVNNDGKVGLCEAVNALQTAVGVRHPIHLV